MKKNILIIVSIVMLLIVMVISTYWIDMNCMEHNKPVMFSTWGYDYAPPENPKTTTENIDSTKCDCNTL